MRVRAPVADADVVCDCVELNEDHGVGGPNPRRGDRVWVYYVGGELHAFATMVLEGEAAHLNNCVVRPEARGASLQKELITSRIDWAFGEWGVDEIRTYTSMDNWHSYRNLIACGFQLQDAVEDDSAGGGAWLRWRLTWPTP